ncbi:MAG TPA: serpin family protein [Solirubrobacterales bacterium]|jgi:serpin B|nr:serpin family protein [Solirubrobacterales bacterium]
METRSLALIVAVCALLTASFAALCGDAGASQGGAATEALALDLLEAGPRGNQITSPDSVATALAMVGTGGVGSTADQIAETLGLPSPAAFGSLGGLQHTIAAEQARAAEGDPDAPTLAFANGLFTQAGFPLKPAFVGGLREHFGAAPEAVDFAGNPAGALGTINSWTNEHTGGLIDELFKKLPLETRLVLADAAYLKGAWRHRFKPADTYRAPFHRTKGKVSVQFLHQATRLPYASGHGYEAVELPYRASTLSLLVVLPRGGKVGALERQLGRVGLSAVVEGLSPRTVELGIPRFHLNTRIDLIPTLEALGLTVPFGEEADFSGITDAEPLRIGAVEHVADLAVDEEGTVAAAVTGVAVIGTSKQAIPRDAVAFDADHPFLFFLRDDDTGAVLFAGRVDDPTLP